MGLTDIIENYPGFDDGIDGFTLGMKMQAGAEKHGAKTLYGTVEAAELQGKTKSVTVDGIKYFARAVVIATGASPRKLGLPEEDGLIGRGVHYCAHCDGRFYKDKTVIVVGGGSSAVSDAVYLSRLARKVYLVHRRDKLRAEKALQGALTQAKNVEFIWNSAITKINAGDRVNSAEIKNILTEDIMTVDADGIFISIGRTPRSELFSDQVMCEGSGYIIADESTKTNIDGVFAIGDVRTKVLRQVVTAVADGAVAAHYAEEYLSTFKQNNAT
jgi:thioredoxin reductase (NADPH)